MIRYYPKNRIKPDQIAKGGELLLDGRPYTGPYYEAFDGRVFTGKDPLDTNANLPLEKIQAGSNPNVEAGIFNRSAAISFSEIKAVENSQGEADNSATSLPLKELVPYYPQPTEQDYTRGYFIRYFGRKVNGKPDIVEITKENHDIMKNRKTSLKDYMYQVVDVFWKLTGPLRDDRVNKQYPIAGIVDTNKRIVEAKDKEFGGLKAYINENYTKFLKNYAQGDYPSDITLPYSRVWTKPVNTYAMNYSKFDISLAPIKNHIFNRVKSQLKVIEAGFYKKALIASNVGPYTIDLKHCLKEGQFVDGNALLVDESRNHSDWSKYIKKLVNNPNMIQDMGERLYETVKDKYNLKNVTADRSEFYKSIVK